MKPAREHRERALRMYLARHPSANDWCDCHFTAHDKWVQTGAVDQRIGHLCALPPLAEALANEHERGKAEGLEEAARSVDERAMDYDRHPEVVGHGGETAEGCRNIAGCIRTLAEKGQ